MEINNSYEIKKFKRIKLCFINLKKYYPNGKNAFWQFKLANSRKIAQKVPHM
jgi:hypothetical protein